MSDFDERSDILSRLQLRLFGEGRPRAPRALEAAGSEERREQARLMRFLDGLSAEKGRTPSPSEPGELDLHLAVKRAAQQDVKECRWSREQIAESLSRLVAQKVTVAQLDAMLAETKPHRLPAEWVPAWVRVTGSRRLLDMLCAEAGFWLADETEHDLAELGRAQLQQERLQLQLGALKSRLAEKV